MTTETGLGVTEDTPDLETTCVEGECPGSANKLHVVTRGRGFNTSGEATAAVSSDGDVMADQPNETVGFRTVLYLK